MGADVIFSGLCGSCVLVITGGWKREIFHEA